MYGRSTSARQWSLALGDHIREMGVKPTRADPDLRIKESEDKSKYKYMTTYVDDIIIVANNPMKYLNKLTNIFLIKNIELAPEFYLGDDIEMKENGTMKIRSK